MILDLYGNVLRILVDVVAICKGFKDLVYSAAIRKGFNGFG